MLVSIATLTEHLNDPTWVIFDCRHDLMDHSKGELRYREGHIPGAHFAPVETVLSGTKSGKNGRHPLPSPEAFAGFLAACGVSPSSTLVAYDDSGGLYAAWFWWLARWIGIKSVSLLDGGINRWMAEGRATSAALPTPRPGPGALHGQANTSLVWKADTVFANLGNPLYAMLDARAVERFRGEVEPMDPVAGHIPGAVNRFYKDNLNADFTFRRPEELKREFSVLLQSHLPENVIHYCGSGITACANIFAMEYAGLPGSKLYAGSWSEWVSNPTRPVTRGAAG